MFVPVHADLHLPGQSPAPVPRPADHPAFSADPAAPVDPDPAAAYAVPAYFPTPFHFDFVVFVVPAVFDPAAYAVPACLPALFACTLALPAYTPALPAPDSEYFCTYPLPAVPAFDLPRLYYLNHPS